MIKIRLFSTVCRDMVRDWGSGMDNSLMDYSPHMEWDRSSCKENRTEIGKDTGRCSRNPRNKCMDKDRRRIKAN